jgi:hypothetical protein
MTPRAQRVVEKAAAAVANAYAPAVDRRAPYAKHMANKAAQGALLAALIELRSLHTDSTVNLDEWIEELQK